MATSDRLIGSLGSFSDTLTLRWDPSAPPDVSSRWLAVMTHVAAITHRTGALMALPEESPEFDPIVARLDDATHRIVIADSPAARIDALDQADAALDRLEALLNASRAEPRSAPGDPDVPFPLRGDVPTGPRPE